MCEMTKGRAFALLPSADGVGEWLHGDRDDDSSGGRRREAVRAILAR